MKLEKIKKILSKHKGKALIGAGLVPVAYLAWKKRGVLWKGIKGLKEKALPKKAEPGDEASRALMKLTDSRKTDLVNTVRFMLSKYDTGPFNIVYGRSRKQGYMGYYVRSDQGSSLFFGWSDELEQRYPATPFWIALDPQATKIFGEKNLKIHYDIYTNPKEDQSILVSIPPEEMEDPQAVSGKIMELARKTLL
ncbi:MAG: hypothetical protein ACYC9O_06280 [Candidatus Latescibacterota bacterium]